MFLTPSSQILLFLLLRIHCNNSLFGAGDVLWVRTLRGNTHCSFTAFRRQANLARPSDYHDQATSCCRASGINGLIRADRRPFSLRYSSFSAPSTLVPVSGQFMNFRYKLSTFPKLQQLSWLLYCVFRVIACISRERACWVSGAFQYVTLQYVALSVLSPHNIGCSAYMMTGCIMDIEGVFSNILFIVESWCA